MLWFGIALELAHLGVVAVLLLTGLLIGLACCCPPSAFSRRRPRGACGAGLAVRHAGALPASAVKASLSEPAYWAYRLNPMAGVVDTFRRGVVLHQVPDPGAIALSAAVVAILLPVAYVYFKHVEVTMADVV